MIRINRTIDVIQLCEDSERDLFTLVSIRISRKFRTREKAAKYLELLDLKNKKILKAANNLRLEKAVAAPKPDQNDQAISQADRECIESVLPFRPKVERKRSPKRAT